MKLGIFAILLAVSATFAENLRCNELGEIPSGPNNLEIRERYRGLKGEIGQRGMEGVAGIPGLDGIVIDGDTMQTRLNALVTSKIEMLTSSYQAKLQALEERFREKIATLPNGAISLTTTPLPTTIPVVSARSASDIAKLRSEGRCSMDHDGICYWAVINAQGNVKKRHAEFNCGILGGQLANIYNQTIYDKLLDVAREAMPRYVDTGILSLSVWTGMTVDQYTGEVKQRDGVSTGYDHWRDAHYPIKGWTLTGLCIHIYRSSGRSDQGMWNCDPNRVLHGGLCEI